MDASCKIQRSIHDVRLTYKYVSRILGTYQKQAVTFLMTIYQANRLTASLCCLYYRKDKGKSQERCGIAEELQSCIR